MDVRSPPLSFPFPSHVPCSTKSAASWKTSIHIGAGEEGLKVSVCAPPVPVYEKAAVEGATVSVDIRAVGTLEKDGEKRVERAGTLRRMWKKVVRRS